MAAHARSTRPEPTPRRRYALRHPGRAAGALGALLVLGGLAATGVAGAATEFDVRYLGDVSVHDPMTGSNCHYHIDEELPGFVPGQDFSRRYNLSYPFNVCGSVSFVFLDLGAVTGEDIRVSAVLSADYQGEQRVMPSDGGQLPPTGGTTNLPPKSDGVVNLHNMTVAVVPS